MYKEDNVRIIIQLSESLVKKIDSLAKKEGVSRNKWIVRVIEEHIKRNTKWTIMK